MAGVDLAEELVRHAAETPFEAIPEAVLEHLAFDLVDSLGVCLGGLRAPGVEVTREVIAGDVRVGQAVVFGTPLRWPAAFAAMANATAGHALDFDDTLDEGGGMHAGVPVHCAALAAADEMGGVSGRDYLAAVALGLDVAVRLALAPAHDYGWHRTSAFGVFGVAVAAGRLRGLDAKRMRHALGIAYSQASGNRQCINDGALSKRLQAGFAARDGVTAARLAELTGAHNVFEGANGFFALYQRGGYDRETVLRGLGREFLSSRISLKPYPCGRNLHPAIDAALALRQRSSGREMSSVEVAVGRRDPEAGAPSFPRDVVQAQFSKPFAVALALVEGRLSIEDFARPETVSPTVTRLFEKVQVVDAPREADAGVRVTVHYADGSSDNEATSAAHGHPSRPLSLAELRAKFHDCNRASGLPLSLEAADRAIDTALGIRTLESTQELTARSAEGSGHFPASTAATLV